MKPKPKDRRQYFKDYYGHRKEKYIQYRLERKEMKKVYDKNWYENNRARISQFSKTIEGRYRTYKASAKKRGFLFQITKEEFGFFIGKPCNYCGEIAFGIDRLNSSLGYIKDNIVSCCRDCNWMKSNKSIEDFINKCNKITSYYG